MTIYDYICQRWPNHAQRIIEATYAQGQQHTLTKDYQDWECVLSHLFIWGATPEGHGYWRELVSGESVEVRR